MSKNYTCSAVVGGDNALKALSRRDRRSMSLCLHAVAFGKGKVVPWKIVPMRGRGHRLFLYPASWQTLVFWGTLIWVRVQRTRPLKFALVVESFFVAFSPEFRM